MAEAKDLATLSVEASQLLATLRRHIRTIDEFKPIYLQAAVAGFSVLGLQSFASIVNANPSISAAPHVVALVISAVAAFRLLDPMLRAMQITSSALTQLKEALQAAEKIASSGYVVADKIAGGDKAIPAVQTLRELGEAIFEGHRRLGTM